MAYPDPEVGLVVSYSYLWSDEAAAGHAEGRKPRPCAVVLEDVNVFTWPGYDLRPISGQSGRYDYGLLPPRFFERIVKRFAQLRQCGRISQTSRDDEA